jgi:CHAT domain-containing protein/lipopolysaccharide biosynthesis regulator YciM
MRQLLASFKVVFLCIITHLIVPSGLAQELQKNANFISADEFFQQGKYKEAIERFQKLSDNYQTENKNIEYSYTNLKIAECNIRLGQTNEGLELAQNTLEYIQSTNITDPNLLAETYNVIGDGYLNLGRNDQALENLQKSLEQFELTNFKETKELANCYNDLGIVYWNNGNNDLALQYHKNALAIRKKLYATENVEIGDSYNNIGLIYSRPNYKDALINFNYALETYIGLYGESHPKVAFCYNNLALTEYFHENYDKSLEYLDKVLAIWNRNDQTDSPNKAFTYISIGSSFYKKNEYDQAIINFEKALKTYLILYGDKHPEIANTFNQLSRAYQARGDFDEALEYSQKSIYANLFDQELQPIYINPELKNYYNADILLSSLQQKAEVFNDFHYNKTLKKRDLIASLNCLELAHKLVSRIRKIRLNEKDKLSLSAKASEIYQSGVELCYELSEVTINKKVYLEKAFDFVERSKSSTLLSAIQDTNAKQFSGIPDELLEKEKNIKNDIAFFERKLAENSGDSQEKFVRGKLLSLNNDYNSFIKDLENQYPRYYNLKFNENQISLEKLQNSLDEQSMFITHFITEDRIFCFYVTKDRLKVYNTPKIKKFDNYISGLRNSIKYDSKKHFLESSSVLFDQLFPAKISSKITNLIVIPEGNLATIPFEVLLSEEIDDLTMDYDQLPFLVKKYNISYDNSGTLYAQRKEEIEGYQGETEDILLVAPVNFKDEYYANMNSKLNDLPGSKNEIDEIKRLFKSKEHGIKVLVDNSATEISFKKEELHKYKYLHFATHGMVNESKPELSRIFLRPTYNDVEDGSLYSGEIYNIDIHADLVCLSACQTGLGKLSKGEGIIGLSRALLYAGAENLIVSLWTVSDNSTSELMIDFYHNHLYSDHYNTFSGALRKAKLNLIKDKEFSKPYYWAPFILIGE